MNRAQEGLLFAATIFGVYGLVFFAVRGIFRLFRSRISGMNRFEKIAWYNLAVFGVSLPVFFMLLWCFTSWNIPSGDPFNAALQLTAMLWIIGMPQGRERFKKDRPGSAPEYDERDHLIKMRAVLHVNRTFIAACLLFLFGMTMYGRDLLLTQELLVTALWVGWGLARVVTAFSTVIQYRVDSLGGNSVEIGLAPETDWDRYIPIFIFFVFGMLLFLFAGFGNWLLVVVFTPLISGSLQLLSRALLNDGNTGDAGFFGRNNLELRIMEGAMCVLFILSFLASIPAVALMYRAHDASDLVAAVPLLGVGLVVFWLAVKLFLVEYREKRRHENP